MLDYMRRNAGSWVIRFLLFGIVISFAFWGVGGFGPDTSTVMTIDKVKVPYNEYNNIYNALYESYRQVYDQLDSATLAQLDIRGQALEALKERYLLLESAKRMNLSVTEEEVLSEITGNSLFFEAGVFSPRLYQAFLDLNRLSRESYEATLAKDALIRKVSDLIMLSAVVTPQEVQDNLDLISRRIAVDAVVLDPNRFLRDVPPPAEEDLLDFYEDNAEQYRVPERFTQAVVILDREDMTGRVDVTSEEIEDWYDDRELEYTEPASFKLRHILFALPEDASVDTITEIRGRAQQIAQDLQEEKTTFANAARQWSDDKETATSGGELEYVSEDDLDRDLLDAVLSLEDGEVSEPIPTQSGFELVSVMDQKAERRIPLDEVREIIEAQLREEKTLDTALDLADDLLDRVESDGITLQKAAQDSELAVVLTPPFSRGQLPGTVDLPTDLLASAFDLEENELGDIYEEGSRIYLSQVIKRTESYIPEFEDVRDPVAGGLLIKQALDKAYEKGEEIVLLISEGSSLKDLARELGISFRTTSPFTVLDRSLPELPGPENLVREAFTIAEPGGAILIEGTQSHYLMVLREVLPPDVELVESQRTLVEDAIRKQREQDVLYSHIERLKEELADKIVVNKQYL